MQQLHQEIYATLQCEENSLNKTLKSSRIKITAFTLSSDCVALGTFTGAIYILQRHNYQFLCHHVVDNANQIIFMRFSPDGQHLAVATSSGQLLIYTVQRPPRCSLKINRKFNDHTGRQITHLLWHQSDQLLLYVADQNGAVSVIRLSSIDLFSPTEETILHLSTSIVQLSAYKSFLLVSCIDKCFLSNCDSRLFYCIGSKPRSGRFGACFYIENNPEQVYIIAARPAFRLWIANLEPRVLETIQLKDFTKSTLFTADLEKNVILKTNKLNSKSDGVFELLVPWRSHFLLAFSHKMTHVFLMSLKHRQLLSVVELLNKDVNRLCGLHHVYPFNISTDSLDLHWISIYSTVDSSSTIQPQRLIQSLNFTMVWKYITSLYWEYFHLANAPEDANNSSQAINNLIILVRLICEHVNVVVVDATVSDGVDVKKDDKDTTTITNMMDLDNLLDNTTGQDYLPLLETLSPQLMETIISHWEEFVNKNNNQNQQKPVDIVNVDEMETLLQLLKTKQEYLLTLPAYRQLHQVDHPDTRSSTNTFHDDEDAVGGGGGAAAAGSVLISHPTNVFPLDSVDNARESRLSDVTETTITSMTTIFPESHLFDNADQISITSSATDNERRSVKDFLSFKGFSNSGFRSVKDSLRQQWSTKTTGIKNFLEKTASTVVESLIESEQVDYDLSDCDETDGATTSNSDTGSPGPQSRRSSSSTLALNNKWQKPADDNESLTSTTSLTDLQRIMSTQQFKRILLELEATVYIAWEKVRQFHSLGSNQGSSLSSTQRVKLEEFINCLDRVVSLFQNDLLSYYLSRFLLYQTFPMDHVRVDVGTNTLTENLYKRDFPVADKYKSELRHLVAICAVHGIFPTSLIHSRVVDDVDGLHVDDVDDADDVDGTDRANDVDIVDGVGNADGVVDVDGVDSVDNEGGVEPVELNEEIEPNEPVESLPCSKNEEEPVVVEEGHEDQKKQDDVENEDEVEQTKEFQEAEDDNDKATVVPKDSLAENEEIPPVNKEDEDKVFGSFLIEEANISPPPRRRFKVLKQNRSSQTDSSQAKSLFNSPSSQTIFATPLVTQSLLEQSELLNELKKREIGIASAEFTETHKQFLQRFYSRFLPYIDEFDVRTTLKNRSLSPNEWAIHIASWSPTSPTQQEQLPGMMEIKSMTQLAYLQRIMNELPMDSVKAYSQLADYDDQLSMMDVLQLFLSSNRILELPFYLLARLHSLNFVGLPRETYFRSIFLHKDILIAAFITSFLASKEFVDEKKLKLCSCGNVRANLLQSQPPIAIAPRLLEWAKDHFQTSEVDDDTFNTLIDLCLQYGYVDGYLDLLICKKDWLHLLPLSIQLCDLSLLKSMGEMKQWTNSHFQQLIELRICQKRNPMDCSSMKESIRASVCIFCSAPLPPYCRAANHPIPWPDLFLFIQLQCKSPIETLQLVNLIPLNIQEESLRDFVNNLLIQINQMKNGISGSVNGNNSQLNLPQNRKKILQFIQMERKMKQQGNNLDLNRQKTMQEQLLNYFVMDASQLVDFTWGRILWENASLCDLCGFACWNETQKEINCLCLPCGHLFHTNCVQLQWPQQVVDSNFLMMNCIFCTTQ